MPVNAIRRSTQVGGALSTLGVAAPAPEPTAVVLVVVVVSGVSSTRARSSVVVAWQGASNP